MIHLENSAHKEVGMSTFMEYMEHLISNNNWVYNKLSYRDKCQLTARFYMEKSECEQKEEFIKADRNFRFSRLAIGILLETARPLDLYKAVEESFVEHYEEQISDIYHKHSFEYQNNIDAENDLMRQWDVAEEMDEVQYG
jgi:hypothetical protein